MNDINHLAVYGSLRRNLTNRTSSHDRYLGDTNQVRFVRDVYVPGRLYDLGWFPGLVPSDEDFVYAELYVLVPSVKNFTVLDALDIYEGYDTANPARSLFTRNAVEVYSVDDRKVFETAWVYYYAGEPTGKFISSGDWNCNN